MPLSSKSYIEHQARGAAPTQVTKKLAQSYIAYPSPLMARIATNWRVADLCAAYNVPKNGCPGGGIIGILELGGGFTQADLDVYSQKNGLPPIVVNSVPVEGGSNQPGGEDDGEVLLDIQVAAATYFYATGTMPIINVFFAPNDFSSFEAVVNAAVAADCDVLSVSFGADEKKWKLGAPGVAEKLDVAVANAAQNNGLVVFAASGDNSSGDLDTGANVDMPSACPHVIACGGTTKIPFGKETVWGTAGDSSGRGTGGGYSNIFPMPSWQSGNGAPPDPEGTSARMVTDVAANANPQTGYLIVINGTEQPVGGTSAVAPLYAGLFAAFGRKLGFVSPTLWQNQGALTDITEGSNGQFFAQVGSDPCTGLGVPNGTLLKNLFTGGLGAGAMATGSGGSSSSSAIVSAQGRKAGAASPHVSGASYTNFALWHGSGPVRFQINDPNITADARVFVSISEYSTDARVDRFIGGAQMSVLNVAPANGAVVILANVNWPTALNVRFDYFVDPQQI